MKVSVITACYNAQDTIEDTIRSVANQTYPDIEYIIIDGASKDKTLEIANKYKDKVSVLISEPDSGVYNAMNKGINAASGDLIFFLNADDIFINETVIENFVKFAENNKQGLILGNIILLDKYNGTVFHEKQPLIDNIQLLKSTVFHPATFFKKEVFEKYGLYNEENKIASDYEWYLNYFVKNKGDYAYLDKPVTIFSMSGISSNEEHSKLHQAERKQIQQKYFTQRQIKTFEVVNKLFPRRIKKVKFRKMLANII